jgi:hypothetical protein
LRDRGDERRVVCHPDSARGRPRPCRSC